MDPEPAQPDLFQNAEPKGGGLLLEFELAEETGEVALIWREAPGRDPVARMQIAYDASHFFMAAASWVWDPPSIGNSRSLGLHRTSIRAQIKRLRTAFPVDDANVSFWSVTRSGGAGESTGDVGVSRRSITRPPDLSPWTMLERRVFGALEAQRAVFEKKVQTAQGDEVTEEIRKAREWRTFTDKFRQGPGRQELQVVLNLPETRIDWHWTEVGDGKQTDWGMVRCAGGNRLEWTLAAEGDRSVLVTTTELADVRAAVEQIQNEHDVRGVRFYHRTREYAYLNPGGRGEPLTGPPRVNPWDWLALHVHQMAQTLTAAGRFPGHWRDPGSSDAGPLDAYEIQEAKRIERMAAQQKRRDEAIRRLRELQRRREMERDKLRRQRQAGGATGAEAATDPGASSVTPKSSLVPPVAVRVEAPPLALPLAPGLLADLRLFRLRERAALWWVSNQSDDLLALPYCQIERLEYQLRTALRVIGPLRGRALLSDEVGLGKTVEAGLVLKEYLTRGMVQRFLVLTVPSLVDQWEEELASKFGLTVATTNHSDFASDPAAFWRERNAVVASLHTLKQPAHLAVAQEVNWDMLIVDEAHYLRNRSSQAWQAVNALPRQFLLLLTATPVQNSLDELYNLVTLLQPGQLPTPKEFRARFVDPKRPHQPREPEELRRLLAQVMIRNTRANAGVSLPPRRAETVLFEASTEELAFWEEWERALRRCLDALPPHQASLWGRLLLQAAGSSPAAWRKALESFPDRSAIREWTARLPPPASWERKCALLAPLARADGGVVVFTQFLETQAALGEWLALQKVPAWMINGQTPAIRRQPITEEFHRRGGALLLTHSGTEGRNLQFCHRLVNFDLPWNPMEIEQRIGRLHRLGQQHPVRICNLVQAGTLQEHLLQVLQEKLNLFELVVGETGLILGDRYSSDEFAEEILRLWREDRGELGKAFQTLGDQLASARADYQEVRKLDQTLFAQDYESI